MRRWLALAIALGGCSERRKPILVTADAGPAVVVVAPQMKRAQVSAVPLLDEVEPDDDVDHAQPMEPGKGVRGTISAPAPLAKGKPRGDVDVYSWLEPGAPSDGGFDEARIELGGVPGLDLVLEVLAGDGSRLWQVNDGGEGEPEVAPNLAFEAGHTYYLRVHASGAKFDPAHPYELVVRTSAAQFGAEREPNDDAPHATRLPQYADANGFYGRRRDEDYLLVVDRSLAQGDRTPGQALLRLELGPVEGVAPELRVVDQSARLLAQAKGSAADELRMRNVGLPADAKLIYVNVRAADGKNVVDRWTLKLGVEAPLEGAEREPNDTPSLAEPLTLEGAQPVAGFLWPGDQDLYRVVGAPELLFTAEVDGVPKVDLKIDRLAPDGKLLARADDAGVGLGERLPPWPIGAGAVLRVSGRAHDAAFDVPYRLSVVALAPDADLEREPNDTPAQATPFREGAAAMHGFLAPRGDQDVYRFVAPPAKTRAIAVVEAPSGISANLRLTDEGRAPLGPAERGGRASGPITPGKSYFVVLKADEKGVNPRQPYRLSLSFE